MSKRGVIVVLSLAAIVAGALLLVRCAPASRRGPSAKAPPVTGRTPSAAVAPDLATGPGYAIDDIELERDHICRDEAVRVKVRGHDPQGGDRWLSARVSLAGSSKEGNDVIIAPGAVQLLSPGVSKEPLVVELWDVRSSQVVSRRTLPFTVDACNAQGGGLRVECALDTPGEGEVVCEARTAGEDGFVPVRTTWRTLAGFEPALGPVEVAGSAWRFIAPPRIVRRATDTLIVEVRAVDAAGQVRTGRGSQSILNHALLTAENAGRLELGVWHFAAPEPQGTTWHTRVEVTNPFDEVVTLTSGSLTTYPCGGGAPTTVAVDPARQLGQQSLQPGQRVAFDWQLPQDAGRCDAQIRVEGRGSSGREATAMWAMPTNPAEQHALGGVARQRLLTALRILSERRGHPVWRASENELADLEAEGLIPAAAQ